MTDTPPDWFGKALAAAQSKDKAEEILKDQELGSMFLCWHVLILLTREERRRCMTWLWERLEADDRAANTEDPS